MYLPIPEPRSPHVAEPPALVRVVVQSDVTWNRPVFKAPPLAAVPPKLDPKRIADDVRRMIHCGR